MYALPQTSIKTGFILCCVIAAMLTCHVEAAKSGRGKESPVLSARHHTVIPQRLRFKAYTKCTLAEAKFKPASGKVWTKEQKQKAKKACCELKDCAWVGDGDNQQGSNSIEEFEAGTRGKCFSTQGLRGPNYCGKGESQTFRCAVGPEIDAEEPNELYFEDIVEDMVSNKDAARDILGSHGTCQSTAVALTAADKMWPRHNYTDKAGCDAGCKPIESIAKDLCIFRAGPEDKGKGVLIRKVDATCQLLFKKNDEDEESIFSEGQEGPDEVVSDSVLDYPLGCFCEPETKYYCNLGEGYSDFPSAFKGFGTCEAMAAGESTSELFGSMGECIGKCVSVDEIPKSVCAYLGKDDVAQLMNIEAATAMCTKPNGFKLTTKTWRDDIPVMECGCTEAPPFRCAVPDNSSFFSDHNAPILDSYGNCKEAGGRMLRAEKEEFVVENRDMRIFQDKASCHKSCKAVSAVADDLCYYTNAPGEADPVLTERSKATCPKGQLFIPKVKGSMAEMSSPEGDGFNLPGSCFCMREQQQSCVKCLGKAYQAKKFWAPGKKCGDDPQVVVDGECATKREVCDLVDSAYEAGRNVGGGNEAESGSKQSGKDTDQGSEEDPCPPESDTVPQDFLEVCSKYEGGGCGTFCREVAKKLKEIAEDDKVRTVIRTDWCKTGNAYNIEGVEGGLDAPDVYKVCSQKTQNPPEHVVCTTPEDLVGYDLTETNLAATERFDVTVACKSPAYVGEASVIPCARGTGGPYKVSGCTPKPEPTPLAPSPPPIQKFCSLPLAAEGVESFVGEGCVAGSSAIKQGTTCDVEAKKGYTCTSPGTCTGGGKGKDVDGSGHSLTEEPPSFERYATCTEMMCPPIVDVAAEEVAGAIGCGLKSVLNDPICRFKCADGYELIGNKTVKCDMTGKWGEKPSCKQLWCPQMTTKPSAEHAGASCFRFSAGSSKPCVFSCQAGYQMVGSKEINCGLDGQWPSQRPVCIPTMCKELVLEAPLQIEKCDDSRRAADKPECTFTCGEMYDLVGTEMVQCDSDGNWVNLPTCEARKCTRSNDETGYVVEYTEMKLTDFQVSATCSPDFSGKAEVEVCDGSEGPVKLKGCYRPNICESPADTAGYIIAVQQARADNFKADVKCAGGYHGEATYSGCNPEPGKGGSTFSVAGCKPNICPDIKVDASQETAGAHCRGDLAFREPRCTFLCDNGYAFAPSTTPTISCSIDGKWQQPYPACTEITCPKLIETASGTTPGASCAGGQVSSQPKCDFTCSDGYFLQGQSVVSCSLEGAWEKTRPACKQIMCPAITDTKWQSRAGAIGCTERPLTSGPTCKFECADGYDLSDPNPIECQQDGSWPVSPTCVARTCEILESNEGEGVEPPKGSCKGAIVTQKPAPSCSYQCGFGFKGDKVVRTCGLDGKWSGNTPSCETNTCESVAPTSSLKVKSGSQGCNGGPAPNRLSCELTCALGYKMAGQAVINCDTDGKWGTKPSCIPFVCRAPASAVGYEILAKDATWISKPFGITAKCAEGFKGVAQVHKCLHPDEMITLSGCVKAAICTAPGVPGYALDITEPQQHKFKATVACSNGYNPNPKPTVKACDPAGGAAKLSGCKMIKCPAVRKEMVPGEGGSLFTPMIECAESNIGETCAVSCGKIEDGYIPAISRRSMNVECTQKGAWSDAPKCKRLSCGGITESAYSSTNVVGTCPAAFVGSSCGGTITCAPGFEASSGNPEGPKTEQLKCLVGTDGPSWEYEGQQCTEMHCQSKTFSSQDGSVTFECAALNEHSTCTFQCAPYESEIWGGISPTSFKFDGTLPVCEQTPNRKGLQWSDGNGRCTPGPSGCPGGSMENGEGKCACLDSTCSTPQKSFWDGNECSCEGNSCAAECTKLGFEEYKNSQGKCECKCKEDLDYDDGKTSYKTSVVNVDGHECIRKQAPEEPNDYRDSHFDYQSDKGHCRLKKHTCGDAKARAHARCGCPQCKTGAKYPGLFACGDDCSCACGRCPDQVSTTWERVVADAKAKMRKVPKDDFTKFTEQDIKNEESQWEGAFSPSRESPLQNEASCQCKCLGEPPSSSYKKADGWNDGTECYFIDGDFMKKSVNNFLAHRKMCKRNLCGPQGFADGAGVGENCKCKPVPTPPPKKVVTKEDDVSTLACDQEFIQSLQIKFYAFTDGSRLSAYNPDQIKLRVPRRGRHGGGPMSQMRNIEAFDKNLKELAVYLKKCPSAKVIFSGHTCRGYQGDGHKKIASQSNGCGRDSDHPLSKTISLGRAYHLAAYFNKKFYSTGGNLAPLFENYYVSKPKLPVRVERENGKDFLSVAVDNSHLNFEVRGYGYNDPLGSGSTISENRRVGIDVIHPTVVAIPPVSSWGRFFP